MPTFSYWGIRVSHFLSVPRDVRMVLGQCEICQRGGGSINELHVRLREVTGPGNWRSSRRFCGNGLVHTTSRKGRRHRQRIIIMAFISANTDECLLSCIPASATPIPTSASVFVRSNAPPQTRGSALPRPPPPPAVCEFINGCRAVRYRDARALAASALIEFNSFRGGGYTAGKRACCRRRDRP